MAESRADELRRRLERDPESRLFAQLAEELRKGGELEEAIRVARNGLEKHPTYPSARLTLGRALLDSGDPAAARVELETAVRDAPDNILASRLLGEALETLGDLGSALLQYRTTLEMAPGDKHVEARVRAIQERLGGPGAPPEPEPAPPPEVTKPMAAVAREGDGPVDAGPKDDEGLPPTIRIRMPGDAAALPRAPLPPTASTVPVDAPDRAEPVFAPTPLTPTEAEVTASELPATLPMPGAKDRAEGELPTEGDGAGEVAEESLEEDSDMAPTLPKSRAPEFAALDEALPPTLPPGVITSVEGLPEAGGDGSDAVPPVPAPPEHEGEALEAAGPGAAEVDAGGDVAEEGVVTPEQAPAPEEASAPEEAAIQEEAFTSAAAVAAEGTADVAAGAAPSGADAPEPGGPAGPEQAPLSSATLAELYFQQGLLERAVEVYGQVLEEEPANEVARRRLGEIEKLATESAEELPVPASDAGDDREVRRRALERAIERLEALLAVVRRR